MYKYCRGRSCIRGHLKTTCNKLGPIFSNLSPDSSTSKPFKTLVRARSVHAQLAGYFQPARLPAPPPRPHSRNTEYLSIGPCSPFARLHGSTVAFNRPVFLVFLVYFRIPSLPFPRSPRLAAPPSVERVCGLSFPARRAVPRLTPFTRSLTTRPHHTTPHPLSSGRPFRLSFKI